MKLFLPVILGAACVALLVCVIATKNGATAQHQADSAAIVDFSNQLVSAQSQVATREASLVASSNSLQEAQAESLALSNRLAEAQAALARQAEQVSSLTGQVSTAQAGTEKLARLAVNLTNQIASLTARLTVITNSLAQTNQALARLTQDYGLLDNRLRIDVAERLVAERKFNNLPALRQQIKYLKNNPAQIVMAESIYLGLNVEVKSNGWCRVIAPN